MKKLIIVWITLFLISPCIAETTTFDCNAVIEDGDVYDIVVIMGNSTVVEMTGGEITGGLFLYDTSTVNISGGVIYKLVKSFNASRINFSSGSIAGSGELYAYGNSRINISSNAYLYDDRVTMYDQAVLVFSDGRISSIHISNDSTVTMTGGTLQNLWVWGLATISGGIVEDGILARGDIGTINVLGGTIQDNISALEDGNVNLFSGTVNNVELHSSSEGIINIYGHDLVMTSYGGSQGYGEVKGFLTDDSPINASLSEDNTYVNLHGGGTPPPTCENRPFSDINWDCKVNLLDFALMASEWLSCGLDPPEACWE